MTVRGKNENDMPAVPDPDFVGTLCEIWFAINYAAYPLAYVRVYLQTGALQTHRDEIRQAEQAFKEVTQAEVIICRAHLAAFFWQVDHLFEALRIAIKKGQKEHADLKYFWAWGKALEKIESSEFYKEINAYRNKSHEFPGIIGSKWEDKGTGPKFVRHFLPTIGSVLAVGPVFYQLASLLSFNPDQRSRAHVAAFELCFCDLTSPASGAIEHTQPLRIPPPQPDLMG